MHCHKAHNSTSFSTFIQCGHGGTHDQLRPTCVNSLSGIQVKRIAAGLWHTLCISVEGHVYAFGGNQFGQLGTGVDQSEVLLRLVNHFCFLLLD